MHNILDDLLGVDADKSHDTSTLEIEDIAKITHRDGRTHRKAVLDTKDQKPPSKESTRDTVGQAETAAVRAQKKEVGVLRFLDLIKMEMKSFKLKIDITGMQKCSCSFAKGALQEEFYIETPDTMSLTETKNVLLVDEDKAFLTTMTNALKGYEHDFTVLTAASGKLALRVLESSKVHLVLTALKMNEMDGFELLLFMQNNYPHIPVMAMSVFDFPAMHKRVEKLGGFRHLIKPIDPPELALHIMEGLLQAGRESVKGTYFIEFLEMLGIDHASCVIEMSVTGKDSFFCTVKDGFVESISCGAVEGEKAVRAILPWNHLKVSFTDHPMAG